MALAALVALCAGALLAARRRGGPSRRRAAVSVVVVAMVVTAAGCSRSGGSSSAAPEHGAPTAPHLAHAPLEWGDGLDHVVVYAVGASGDAPAPRSGGGRSRPARIGERDDQQDAGLDGDGQPLPATEQTAQVHLLDGSTTRVTIPRETLVAVAPASDEESAAVHRALEGGASFALVVLDREGVVGERGERYVLTAGSLEQLPRLAAPTPTSSTPTSTSSTSTSTSSTAPTVAPSSGAPVTTEPPSGTHVGDEAASSPQDGFLDALREVDGVVSVTHVAPGVAAVATSGSRDDLARVPGVDRVADDSLLDFAADDARQGEQWMLANTGSAAQAGGWEGVAGADTRAPRAWAVTDGAGVIVAVVDSGVDLAHPELAPRIWTNPGDTCGNFLDDDGNGNVDDCHGWDFGTDDGNPGPDVTVAANEHGTHVAGLIGAGRDGAGVVGIAPGATLMPLKVANATGAISTSAVAAAVVYAVDHGAQVVNVSLASRPGTTRAAVSALEHAIVYARAHGVLVVTGTGNDGIDITTKAKAVWPAGFSLLFDNVIAVGATTNADSRASFSNFGDPTTLHAPGWWLLSTLPGGAHGFASGTSQASAVVAGAAADVIASGLAVTPSAVRARLIDTAAVTPAGYRLDVAAAVGIPPDPVIGVVYEGIDTLAPDEAGTVDVRITATKMPAPVAKVRLSLAAAVDYAVFAVEGATGVMTEPGGSTSVLTTGPDGAFPPIAVLDPVALATTGWVLSTQLALPRGDYALVTEMLDAADHPLGGAQAAYVSVGGGLPVTSTTASTLPTTIVTTVPGGPTTTQPSTSSTAPASTGPEPTLPGPTTTNETTTTTEAPATTADASVTTEPATTLAPTTVPETTVPPTATTAPTTTVPATTTTASSPTTSAPPTTVPATTIAPTPTTTPPPTGDEEGIYSIADMQPRYATLAGGTPLTITGVFPTTIPVYVWFGDKGIVSATSSDGTTLSLLSPAVQSAGVTDVTVKFTLDTTYELTLADAFTFGVAPAGSTTTLPGASTVPATTAPTTSLPGATTTLPGATTTAGPASTAATSSTVAVTTTLPGLIADAVRLRPQPSTGALAVLTTAGWPRPGCVGSSCPAASL